MNREIFVVDDNVDYQFLFFRLLKELDRPCTVKFFENAKACHQHLELLKMNKPKDLPSLIVTDLHMPGMNGLHLLKLLKSEGKSTGLPVYDTPVVVMTSYLSDQQVQQCYKAGANAVIIKPIDSLLMKTTVQSICNFWVDRVN
ncbi:response regulator [Dyadobacter sp. CY345]|uniref:response regulator n=1 Tax=Dyadobacter sp. CY345 TaxID=2909335 RepID=UPI001F251B49|nr:response regulator [Dyadobacter sp. CY345]MCF2446677.1 response regulator [Dyadobacter sp. CY345]